MLQAHKLIIKFICKTKVCVVLLESSLLFWEVIKQSFYCLFLRFHLVFLFLGHHVWRALTWPTRKWRKTWVGGEIGKEKPEWASIFYVHTIKLMCNLLLYAFNRTCQILLQVYNCVTAAESFPTRLHLNKP